MYHIGLDLGSTLSKMALIQPEAADFPQPQVFFQYPTQESPQAFVEALASFLQQQHISLRDIDKVTVTGTHANTIGATVFDIPVTQVSEVPSIGAGGLALSGQKEALVVNMGTGTTYVMAREHDACHIAGTGVGGGTLAGLGAALLHTDDVAQMLALAAQGCYHHVDLLMRDITDVDYPNLPPYLTASNFGKFAVPALRQQANRSDLAAGLVNLILQVIGSMAVMICKSLPTTQIVLVGQLTQLPQAQEVYSLFSKVYGLHFIIPPFAVHATALGSMLV